MKARSEKQQVHTGGVKAGASSPSHVECEKTSLEHRDESVNTNPNSQTLFTQTTQPYLPNIPPLIKYIVRTEQEQEPFLFPIREREEEIKNRKKKEVEKEIVTGFSNPTQSASPVAISTQNSEAGNKQPWTMEPPMIEHSATNMPPALSHLFSADSCGAEKMSSPLPCSHSLPSLSKLNKSLPDMLKDSFKKFSPNVKGDENEEIYSFHCSGPGLYHCSVTDLVFHMEGEGEVVYSIVPWNHRLLSQHHKKPAGPLFDIKCLQQSVFQLHLPHCEDPSTDGCNFLSVAHVNREGIELIKPHKVTETHVIINTPEFSCLGNVKDEDSPPEPIRALVLLFYRPPTDSNPESLLNVLLLPKNIVLRDVQRMRKRLVGEEQYIELSPHCRLQPKEAYRLSTIPENDSVLVQPTEADFDEESYDNYFPSFQVTWRESMTYIKLSLKDSKNSQGVWERNVCLLSPGDRQSHRPGALDLPANEKLRNIRTSFINGVSGPVLNSLVDKLLGKEVLTESEAASAYKMQDPQDKARCVIDMVRHKGEDASSKMITILSEENQFLCENFGLN